MFCTVVEDRIESMWYIGFHARNAPNLSWFLWAHLHEMNLRPECHPGLRKGDFVLIQTTPIILNFSFTSLFQVTGLFFNPCLRLLEELFVICLYFCTPITCRERAYWGGVLNNSERLKHGFHWNLSESVPINRQAASIKMSSLSGRNNVR